MKYLFIFLLSFSAFAEQSPCRNIHQDNWTNPPVKDLQEFVKKLLEIPKKEIKPQPVIIIYKD